MEKYTFKSKVDWWILLILILACLFITSIIFWEFNWVSLILAITVDFFILDTLFNTSYTISGSELIVKSSVFMKSSIDIKSIRSIVRTNSILSAPALSLDRICIKYNQYDEIIISPKDLEGFINRLKNVNENCTLSENKRVSKK